MGLRVPLLVLAADVQAAPPSHAQWSKLDHLSDEFNGDSLDMGKWLNYHPLWAGRPPAKFSTDNVQVSGGNLLLKSTVADESMQGDWIKAACLSSKERSVQFGYFEVRMQASKSAMTAAFWLKDKGNGYEIDVQEAMGRPPFSDSDYFKKSMHCTTHDFTAGVDKDVSHTKSFDLNNLDAAADFQVYGLERNASSITWYLNDKPVWSRPTEGFTPDMYLFLDTEVFTWMNGGISPNMLSDLKDSSKSTAYVDWVRSYSYASETMV
jgi:beta-glucanase (GH16 family)